MAGQAEEASDRSRFLALLTRDVDRLERLVSDVRELARIDTQLEQEPVHVVEAVSVVSQVIDGLRLARPDGPEVALRSNGRVRVKASPDRLAQALENVLSNARSFAPPETLVEVVVSERAHVCEIVIADRGPGIPPGHLDRVFDRFFTYRPATASGRPDHAGLGLAIARTVIRGYGGTILARNREGGGACFEIRIPVDGAPRPRG
jgi:two-component system sensor histidine kinase ChvG